MQNINFSFIFISSAGAVLCVFNNLKQTLSRGLMQITRHILYSNIAFQWWRRARPAHCHIRGEVLRTLSETLIKISHLRTIDMLHLYWGAVYPIVSTYFPVRAWYWLGSTDRCLADLWSCLLFACWGWRGQSFPDFLFSFLRKCPLGSYHWLAVVHHNSDLHTDYWHIPGPQ